MNRTCFYIFHKHFILQRMMTQKDDKPCTKRTLKKELLKNFTSKAFQLIDDLFKFRHIVKVVITTLGKFYTCYAVS